VDVSREGDRMSEFHSIHRRIDKQVAEL